jgi:C_GCAxxG_C_C family probable redox protein
VSERDEAAADLRTLEARAVDEARAAFLEDEGMYGCAEAAFIGLARAFGVTPDPSIVMALNGGVAYGGGVCGAVTGTAVAVGALAGARIADHRIAKRVARDLVIEAETGFRSEFGATTCRELTGFDLRAPGGHDAFVADGAWRVGCTARIEHMVRVLAPLAGEACWQRRLREIAEVPSTPAGQRPDPGPEPAGST